MDDETVSAKAAAGERVGPYLIEEQIGAGGMGRVFRAIDSRLGRKVAIKFLAEQFNERFHREARAISALNHPNICTLFDVGPNFLVMELLEGDTLAGVLKKKGKLGPEVALAHGAQIGAALAEAHGKGIVHRDLKPANIMVTGNGIKVMDFGLAKSAADETITASRMVMGTPAYMAPEQREGGECDARTDIYALGLVLYEMLAGKRPSQPPADLALPTQLAHLVARCLAPEPADRWQSARDVKAELEWAAKNLRSIAAPAPRRPSWIWAVAALTALGVLAAILLRPERMVPPPAAARVQLLLDTSEYVTQAPEGGSAGIPVPSPDGRFIVFPGSSREGGSVLWIRALESPAASPLPGTEGAQGAVFWSPDSRWIAFFADKKLKKTSPAGGSPQTIALVPGVQDGSWGAQGAILLRMANRAPLSKLSAEGGAPVPVTRLDESRTENSHRYPSFLPDGQRFLFTARCAERDKNSLYLGSLVTGRTQRIMHVDSNVDYVSSAGGTAGRLIYYLDGALVSQAFDPDRVQVSGEPNPVYDGVAYNAPSLRAGFAASRGDGRLVLIQLRGAYDQELRWQDRAGNPAGVLGPRGEYLQPRISPDGSRLAFTRPDPQTGNRDIFVSEVASGTVSRLTSHVANDWYLAWSPDGKQILFGSDRGGGTKILSHVKRSTEPGSAESLYPGEEPSDWSPDGRWIALGSSDLWVAPAEPSSKPFAYLVTPFREGSAYFSPDGRWLAYTSDESGQFEVYVRPFTGGPAPAEGQSVNAFVCTAEVPNLDEYLKKATAAGGTIAVPKMAVPTVGWLAYFKDTEGNIFGMMQRDPNAK